MKILDIVCLVAAAGFTMTIVVWTVGGVSYALLTRRQHRGNPAAQRAQFDRFMRFLPLFHVLAGSTLVLLFASLLLRGWLE